MSSRQADSDGERIDHVLRLAIAQDDTTWKALSLFLAAEVVLLGFVISTSDSSILRAVAVLAGLVLTGASMMIVWRSNDYLVKYWRLLRDSGREYFDIHALGIRSWSVVVALHLWLFIQWGFALGWTLATWR